MLRGVRRALNGRRNHNKSDTKEEEEVREDDNDELVVGEEEEDYNGTSNQDHEHNTAKKMKQQQKNPYKTLTQAGAGTTTSRTLLSPLNSTEAEMIGYVPTSSTSELDDSFSYIREEEELAFHNNNHNSSYTLHNKEPQDNEQESSSCLVGAAAVAFPLPQQQQREASTETTTMEPQQEQRQESIPISPTTSHTQKTTTTATTTTTCTTTTLQHEESSPSPSSSSACPEQQEQEQPPPPPRITTTTTSSSCSPVVEEETCIPEHMAVDDTNSLQFSYPSQQMSLLSTSPIHSNMHTYYSKNNNNNFSQPECHTHNNLPRGAGGCSSSTPAVPKASFLRTPSPKREGPSGKYPPRPQLYSTIPATVTGSTSLSPSGPPLSSPPGMTTVSTHTAQYLSPSKPSPPPPSGMGGIVDRAGAGMRGYSICSYSSDDDDGVTMDPSILSTASSLTADDCFLTTTTPTPAPPSGTTISATMRSSPTSDASGRTQWLVEDVPQWQGHGSLLGLAPKQSASRSTAKDDDDDIDIALDECQDAKKMELIRADFIAYNSAYSPNMNDHDEVFEEDDNNAGDEDMEDLLSWNGGSRPSRVLSSSSVFRPGNNMNNSKATTPPTKTMPISAASVTATTMPSPHNHTTNTTPTNQNVCTPPALSNQSCLSLSQVRRLKSKARLENLAKADVPCSSSSGGGGGDHNDKSPPEALTPPRTTVLTMTSRGDASLPSLTSRGDASLPSLTSGGDASLPSLTSRGDASLPSSPLPRTVEFPKEEQEEKQDPQSPTRREQIELLPPCSPASASSSTSSPSLMLNHNKSNTQHTLFKPTTTTSPAIRAATTPEETAVASPVRKEMESESMGEGFRSASPKVERSRAVYRTNPVLFSRLPPRETKESPPEKEELEEDGDVHVNEEENPLEKAPSQQQPQEPPTPKHRNSTIRTMEHDDNKKNTTQDKDEDEPDTSNQNENSNTTNQAVAMGGKKRKSIRRGFSSIFRSLRRNPTLTSAAMDKNKNNNNESPRNTTSPTRKSLRHRRKRSQMTADAPIANTLSSSPAEQETCPRPQRPIHPPQQQRQNQQQRQQEVTEEEELTKATEGGESSKRRKRGSHNQGEVERAAVEPKEGQLWQLNRSLSRESVSTAGLSQSSSYTFRFVGVLDAETSKDKSSSEVTSTASLESPRRKPLYAESAPSSTSSANALVVQNHKTKTQPETPKTERSNYSGRARYSTPAIEQARLRKEAASSRAAQVKSQTKARSDSFYQTQNKNVGASVTWFVCLENNTAPLHVAQDADLHQVSLQEKPQEQQQDGKATVPFMLLPVRSDSPKRTHKSNSPTRPFMPHVQSTQSFHSPRKRTTVECADGSHLRSKLFDPGRLKRLVGGGNDSSSSTDLVVSTQAQESSSSLRTLALLDHQHQLGSSTAMVVRREEDRAIVPFEESGSIVPLEEDDDEEDLEIRKPPTLGRLSSKSSSLSLLLEDRQMQLQRARGTEPRGMEHIRVPPTPLVRSDSHSRLLSETPTAVLYHPKPYRSPAVVGQAMEALQQLEERKTRLRRLRLRKGGGRGGNNTASTSATTNSGSAASSCSISTHAATTIPY